MDPQTSGVAVFRTGEAVVAESLVLIDGAMWWCDITAGNIRRSAPGDPADGSRDTTLTLPPPVCSFAPTTAGGLVVSLGDRVVLVDRAGNVERTLAVIEHAHPEMRLNEGKVDPAGRWVTGSMELEDGCADGAFYSVDGSGRVRTLVGGLGVANGLEWSLDGTRVWFTDTSVGTIFTGGYTPAGEIVDIEVWREGAPHDGLVIDASGRFWSGIFGDGRLMHLDRDGAELFSIQLPAPHLTSVAFDAGTLYVASAREKLTAQQIADHPLSGSVFTVATSASGVPRRPFEV